MTDNSTQTLDTKRERNKETNRRLIMAAAKELFTERGYDAVSIRDIIGATGLASGTFYNYFSDKEAVFVKVMKLEVMQISKDLTFIRNNATDLQSFLYDSYLHVFRYFHQQPEVFRLIDRNETQVRELYKFGVLETTMNDLISDLKTAMASGLIAEADVDYLAAALYGLGYEMVRVMVSRGDSASPEEAARIASSLVRKGLDPCC